MSIIGRSLAGRYEIQALIGEGAMGRVYRACDTQTAEVIAIKVLHRHLALDPRVGKRFHREARAASLLSHPHSLQVRTYGEDEDGTLYIAMELLEGGDMLSLLEDEAPLTPNRIIDIMAQSLSALGEAHRAGIIHRDFKPENVFISVTEDGRDHVKVCDFGIAKIVEAEGGSAITVSGFVCGTPEYMAPEQARGEDIDARTDLYAAGCMLYQLLTEEVPFSGDTPLGIITQHLTDYAVPPPQRRPELRIPSALTRIAARAMAKEARYRYPSAESMRDALLSVAESLGSLGDLSLTDLAEDPTEDLDVDPPDTPTLPPPKPIRTQVDARTPWFISAGILLIGVGIGALLLNVWGPTPDSPHPASTANPPETRVASPEVTPPEDASALAVDTAGPETAAAAPTPDAQVESPPEETSEPRVASSRRTEPRAAPRRTETETAVTPTPERNVEAPSSPSTEPAAAPEPPRPLSAYEQGRQAFLANDLPAALRHFRRAAQEAPRSPRVYKQLGRAYMRAGQVADGVRAYRRYLQLAPNAPDRPIIEQLLSQHGGP